MLKALLAAVVTICHFLPGLALLPIYDQHHSEIPEAIVRGEFARFKANYAKSYADKVEEAYRYRVFRRNLAAIGELQSKTNLTQYGVTKFSDLTQEEFRARYLNTRPGHRSQHRIRVFEEGNLPDAVDWRTTGAVSPVKDQGVCTANWAFSAIGALEGIYQITKGGNVPSFSAQQVVDCSVDFGNQGCNGGEIDTTFRYVTKKGIELEKDYPYHAADQNCKYKQSLVIMNGTGSSDVKTNDQEQLTAAVAKQPISILVEADQQVFQFYTSGIIDSDACGTQLNHGLLLVGYNNTHSERYWLIKNEWGTDWGEDGYVRILKTSEGGPGICGIAVSPSFPHPPK